MGKNYEVLVDDDVSANGFSLFDLILSGYSYFATSIFPVFEKYFMAFVVGFLAIGWPAFISSFIWGIMPPALPGHAMTLAGGVFLGASILSGIFEMIVQTWNDYIEDNLSKVKGLKKQSKNLNKEAIELDRSLTKYLAWARGKLLEVMNPKMVCDDERPERVTNEDITKVLDAVTKLRQEVKEGIAEAEEVNSKVNIRYFFAVAKTLVTAVASAGLPIFCVLTTNAVILTVPLIMFNVVIGLCGAWGLYQAVKYFNEQTQSFFDHKLAVEKLRDQDAALTKTATTLTETKNRVTNFTENLKSTKSDALTDVQLKTYEYKYISRQQLESALSSKTMPLWSFAEGMKKIGAFSQKLAGTNGASAAKVKDGFESKVAPERFAERGAVI